VRKERVENPSHPHVLLAGITLFSALGLV